VAARKMSGSAKRKVHERDRVCQGCGHKGSDDNPLQVHHIKPRSTHPKLVNKLSNCVLLCNECHKKAEDNVHWV
jgi:5-methylcytosine-specific restriction endonuclease McrA